MLKSGGIGLNGSQGYLAISLQFRACIPQRSLTVPHSSQHECAVGAELGA